MCQTKAKKAEALAWHIGLRLQWGAQALGTDVFEERLCHNTKRWKHLLRQVLSRLVSKRGPIIVR